jgi:hypothetical protein
MGVCKNQRNSFLNETDKAPEDPKYCYVTICLLICSNGIKGRLSNGVQDLMANFHLEIFLLVASCMVASK